MGSLPIVPRGVKGKNSGRLSLVRVESAQPSHVILDHHAPSAGGMGPGAEVWHPPALARRPMLRGLHRVMDPARRYAEVTGDPRDPEARLRRQRRTDADHAATARAARKVSAASAMLPP